MSEPGLDRVIRGAYQLLGLQTYFTAGEKEVRAWTVRAGSTAPQAAGVIHTDFERGFIRAEVIGYADYIACKGEAGAKEAGKLRLEGKEYIVRKAMSCTSASTSSGVWTQALVTSNRPGAARMFEGPPAGAP